MAKTTPRQLKTIGRVMHEYEHGELKSAPQGNGGKGKSRRQAIAIALSESGASQDQTPSQSRRAEARIEKKEARGRTAQQETEGKSHVGAKGRRESSPAMGGKNATRLTAAGKRGARARSRDGGDTKAELYKQAKRQHIEGRSKMSKQQLENALH